MLYLLDTNIIIDWLCAGPSQVFLNAKIAEPGTQLMTSWICAAEFLVKASPNEKKILFAILESEDILLKELNGLKALEQVAQCRRKTSLPLPDVIILVTAKIEKATLLTRDLQFAKSGKKFYPNIVIP